MPKSIEVISGYFDTGDWFLQKEGLVYSQGILSDELLIPYSEIVTLDVENEVFRYKYINLKLIGGKVIKGKAKNSSYSELLDSYHRFGNKPKGINLPLIKPMTLKEKGFRVLGILFILLFIYSVVTKENVSNSSTSNPPTISAPSNNDDNYETVAAMINLNGFLCAKVTNVTELRQKDIYEVECILYRGGSTKQVYLANAKTGVVSQQ